MNRSTALMASAIGQLSAQIDLSIRRVKPLKTCMMCGNLHNHNNSFCSAECCRKYTENRKREKRINSGDE